MIRRATLKLLQGVGHREPLSSCGLRKKIGSSRNSRHIAKPCFGLRSHVPTNGRLLCATLHNKQCSQQHDQPSAPINANNVKCIGPVLPLSERPVQARVSQDALLAWHQSAVAQAEAIGSAFANADGGPSAEDLQTELNWLLDDAVESVQASTDSKWKPCTWRHLQSQLHMYPADAASSSVKKSVALRVDIDTLNQLWKQRTQDRVPLQYLNNCCHWRDMILAVGPGVLIPRPETEMLIDLAQQAMHDQPQLKQGPWLDLGTGSGAIAIALAKCLPQATQVYAVDKSVEAVAWAKLNVQRLGLTDRVQVKTGSWFEPVMKLRSKVAGIVSNPPYIPASQMNDLQAEVRLYEPWLALNGGQGMGLDSLTLICQGALQMLQPGGFFALETTGGEQARQVVSMLLETSTLTGRPHIVEDLAGIARFVVAYKPLHWEQAS